MRRRGGIGEGGGAEEGEEGKWKRREWGMRMMRRTRGKWVGDRTISQHERMESTISWRGNSGNSTKNILYQMVTVIYYRGRNNSRELKAKTNGAKNPADTLECAGNK